MFIISIQKSICFSSLKPFSEVKMKNIMITDLLSTIRIETHLYKKFTTLNEANYYVGLPNGSYTIKLLFF